MRLKVEFLLHWFHSTSPNTFQPAYRDFTGILGIRRTLTDVPRQIRVMERQQLLEKLESAHSRTVLYRITEKGRLVALGGRDPERQWNRYWDGLWRFLLFGIPERDRLARVRLRTKLRQAHFGCLQRSVWISPDNFQDNRDEWFRIGVNPRCLTLLEGHPACQEKSYTLTSRAWNFVLINHAWEQLSRHLDLLETLPAQDDYGNLANWFRKEHHYWRKITSVDPLLPVYLLPKDYPGIQVWRRRKRAMKSFARRIKGYF